MTQTNILTATEALQALYADWEANGGPSPDTRDENGAVAAALGLEEIDDEAVLENIWYRNCDGLELHELAALHVKALSRSVDKHAPIDPYANSGPRSKCDCGAEITCDGENYLDADGSAFCLLPNK